MKIVVRGLFYLIFGGLLGLSCEDSSSDSDFVDDYEYSNDYTEEEEEQGRCLGDNCFEPTDLTEELLANPTEEALEEVLEEYTPTDRDVALAAFYLHYIAYAQETGEMPESFYELELQAAMESLLRKYPSYFGPDGEARMQDIYFALQPGDSFDCTTDCTVDAAALAQTVGSAGFGIAIGAVGLKAAKVAIQQGANAIGVGMGAKDIAENWAEENPEDVTNVLDFVSSAAGVAGFAAAIIGSAVAAKALAILSIGAAAASVAVYLNDLKKVYSQCKEYKEEWCCESPGYYKVGNLTDDDEEEERCVECWADGQCQADEICLNEECVAKEGGCCQSSETGETYCLGASETPGCNNCGCDVNCVTFGDCCADSCAVCGACEEECTVDSDCEEGQVCILAECQEQPEEEECASDGDCETGQVCLNGSCETESQGACEDGNYEAAKQILSYQLPAGQECLTDIDCTDDFTETCMGGHCATNCGPYAEVKVCPSGQVCGGSRYSNKTVCVEEDEYDDEGNLVKGCNGDSDCGANQWCASTLNKCLPSTCDSDSDCGPLQECFKGYNSSASYCQWKTWCEGSGYLCSPEMGSEGGCCIYGYCMSM